MERQRRGAGVSAHAHNGGHSCYRSIGKTHRAMDKDQQIDCQLVTSFGDIGTLQSCWDEGVLTSAWDAGARGMSCAVMLN